MRQHTSSVVPEAGAVGGAVANAPDTTTMGIKCRGFESLLCHTSLSGCDICLQILLFEPGFGDGGKALS